MRIQRKNRKEHVLFAAAGAVALSALSALAGTNGAGTADQEVTISISGSTALKKFIVSQGFTDLIPGNSITLNIGGTLGAGPTTITAGENSIELAPNTFTPNDFEVNSTTYNALRVEYHESGSVEGIYELANDQVGPLTYVEDNINRDPNGGNAVWVNGNQIGGVGAPNGNSLTPPNNDPGNNYLGAFYGTNGSGTPIVFGPGVNGTFSLSGQNIGSVSSPYSQAGQNAVQLAISDVVPVQAFANDYGNPGTVASEPWFSTPQNYGYGEGDTALRPGGLGVAGGGVELQTSSVLNMAASAINPRTGGTFGVGPWNTAGLGNLDSETTAVTSTLFVANPGTGLDRLNRTDAQWLQTTGRLANGAAFDMTTRDVNSGTHNVSSLDIGIDPSWAVGVDDSGNGNAVNGATTQINVGSTRLNSLVNVGLIRFSNKTSGGAQLRPTVQDARMAVGTLGTSDATGVFATGNAYGLRSLEYADGVAGSTAPYVQSSAYSIINGQYVLYQNEQFVTLKAPQTDDSNFDSLSTAAWAQISTNGSVTVYNSNSPSLSTVPIQGDDSTGAVSQVIDNVQESEGNIAAAGFESSAFAYIQNGYIVPNFMAVEKPEDGIGLSTPVPLAQQDTSDAYSLLTSNLTVNTTGSLPDAVTFHTGDVYGGKGSNSGQFAEGSIPQTASNYLFGNFNQNGIRDFDSVVVQATEALAVLENAEDQKNGGTMTSSTVNSGLLNSTVIGTLGPVTVGGITYTMPAPLATMSNSNVGNTLGLGVVGETKGDLIMMGDFDGRGAFDGKSLYELAVGASLADATSTFVTTSQNAGGNDHLTLQGETLSVEVVNNRDGSQTGSTGQSLTLSTVNTETYGDAVRRATLFKNAALDYLNNFATPQMKMEGASVLSVAGTSAMVPFGATDLGNDGNGNEYFTYDPNGTNAFNKADVDRSGLVDFNSAILVDGSIGKDYSNLNDELSTTEQAPYTGAATPFNLVLAKLVDPTAANPSTTIGTADLAVENSAMAVTGNANWYGYNIEKTGPGTIVWGRTAGAVTVYTGAAFGISAGAVQVGGTLDPFSDTNSGGATQGNHVAVTVGGGAALRLTTNPLITVSGLTVNGGGTVDVGTGSVVIDYKTPANDPISTVVSELSTGYSAATVWTGTSPTVGVITSSAAAGSHTVTLGYLDGNTDTGLPAVQANQVLVKYALVGDSDLSGEVDFADLASVLKHFNQSGTDWAAGNFEYAANSPSIASTNFNDLADVLKNFLQTTPGSGGGEALGGTAQALSATAQVQTTAVPEPASLSLLAAGAAGLLACRKRRRNA